MAYGNQESGKSDWDPKTRRLGDRNRTSFEAHIARERGGLSDEILPIASQSNEEARTELARRSRAARGHRVELFGSAIARELPWDILLLLYVHHERARLKVSSIFAEVGGPPTTVLRWLKHLDAKGFIAREPHPSDQRIMFVKLSRAGKCTLDLYFESMLSQNDPAI